MMDVSQALEDAASALARAGVPTPRSEAAWLMQFVLRKEAAFLVAHPEHELSVREYEDFRVVVDRRSRHEPFHYITGSREFYGRRFGVGSGVLIPRPETEVLVEAAIATLRGRKARRFCEIGVGTGCVAVSILKALPNASGVASDTSEAALTLAAANAARHQVSERLTLLRGDLFGSARGPFDLIVSNPPYIPESDFDTLQAEVRFEPREALLGGPDGLAVIRRLIRDSPANLVKGGVLLTEIGFGQAERVMGLFDTEVWTDTELRSDLQGIPRVVKATLEK